MAKLIITDGIALVKLSPMQRLLLRRHYIAFELDRILKVTAEPTPTKAELGKKTQFGWVFFTRTGEYRNGAKRTLFVGSGKEHCVRILLLSASIDELYVSSSKQFEYFSVLKAHQSPVVFPKD